MPDVVIKGGRVVDATGDRIADVAVDDGRIVGVGERLDGDIVLDAGGAVVAPALVDLHAHLREPGDEQAETIESASRAAVLGGFGALIAMPDTMPTVDNAAVVRDVLELGRSALCHIHVAGAITRDRRGERLAPMQEMAELGVRLFTDAPRGVQDDRLMRRALEYASGLGVTLAQHCDNEALSEGGHMNEGAMSSSLGIPGAPAEAEELMVMRDVTLSRLTGAPVHLQHLSTAGSMGILRAARSSGLPVTGAVTPPHFSLTEKEVASFDAVYKLDPPLRTADDVSAVRVALADGIVDAITSDHRPHEPQLKELPFDEAPAGALGLETTLAVALTDLDLPLPEIIGMLSWRPAAIAGIADTHGGPVAPGRPANLTVIDPSVRWTVDASAGASRSTNDPFDGRTLSGKVRHTLVGGIAVVVDGEVQR